MFLFASNTVPHAVIFNELDRKVLLRWLPAGTFIYFQFFSRDDFNRPLNPKSPSKIRETVTRAGSALPNRRIHTRPKQPSAERGRSRLLPLGRLLSRAGSHARFREPIKAPEKGDDPTDRASPRLVGLGSRFPTTRARTCDGSSHRLQMSRKARRAGGRVGREKLLPPPLLCSTLPSLSGASSAVFPSCRREPSRSL